MYFENGSVVIDEAGEAVLSDTKFGERTASQRLDEVGRSSPLRVHDLVEFRYEAILNVWIEILELIGGPLCESQLQLSSPLILVPVHHLDDILSRD